MILFEVVMVERQQEPPPRPTSIKVETRMQPTYSSPDNQSPTPPTSPTQVTLAKAPTPWMKQKTTKQPEEMPEWAKKAGNRTQDIQFDDDVNAMMYQQPARTVVDSAPKQRPGVQQQFIPQHQMRQIPQDNKFVVPRVSCTARELRVSEGFRNNNTTP